MSETEIESELRDHAHELREIRWRKAALHPYGRGVCACCGQRPQRERRGRCDICDEFACNNCCVRVFYPPKDGLKDIVVVCLACRPGACEAINEALAKGDDTP